jgi:hypothetical protein
MKMMVMPWEALMKTKKKLLKQQAMEKAGEKKRCSLALYCNFSENFAAG